MTALASPSIAATLDVLRTKLAPPPHRASTIGRDAPIRRLLGSRACPVVAVIAPAGYGKSTLVAEWAAVDDRRFSWYSADARDSDPATLLRGLTAAIGSVVELDDRVIDAVARPGLSIWSRALPRLGMAVHAAPAFVLAVDDMDRIEDRESLEVIVTLAGHLPEGSQVVVIGRSANLLPLARLVSRDQVLVLDRDDLAFSDSEVASLATSIGVPFSSDEAATVHRRTEGWAVGAYLSILAARTDRRVMPSTGGAPMLEEYLRSEVLAGLPDDDVEFMLHTSVLDRLHGGLCDAVLERSESADVLDRLERTNLFVIPLDRATGWYRYHHLLTELLPAELERRRPGSRRKLFARAAEWHERAGDLEIALEYALASHDQDRAARLLFGLAQPTLNAGRIQTLRRWFAAFDNESAAERYPGLMALGAIMVAMDGDSGAADRWLNRFAPPRDHASGEDEAAGISAYVRAYFCPDGPETMLRDAELAMRLLPEAHPYRIATVAAYGGALLLAGDATAADEVFAEAIALFDRYGRAATGVVNALAHRAWLAIGRGDLTAAAVHEQRARTIVFEAGLEQQAAGAVLAVVSARLAARRGASAQARADLALGLRLRERFGYALPWVAVRSRLELARAALALGDAGAARTLMADIDTIFVERPDLGVLGDEVATLAARVRAMPETRFTASSLTMAELRLLPLLTTHLSFSEIGSRFAISSNTVKTQAKSIYRKLDAGSRSEAVATAVERGLLEAMPLSLA